MSHEQYPGKELTLQDWDERFWKSEDKDPPFHVQTTHQTLLKYYDKLFPNNKEGRVLLPLCGKSLDLIYFADLGHEVVGVEFSEIAVAAFFNENKLAFSKTNLENVPFVLYKAKDKNITIYRGDFYDFSRDVGGEFDAFWDRGSFSAINMLQRKQYTDLMFSLMKPTSKYLLQVCLYDGSKYGGPPHYTTEDAIKNTFGRKCSHELLEKRESTPPNIVQQEIEWSIIVYLLQLNEKN